MRPAAQDAGSCRTRRGGGAVRNPGDEARPAVAASRAELGRVQVQHGVDIEGAQAAAPACLVGVAPVGDLPEPQALITHPRDRGQHGFGAIRRCGGDDDAFGEARHRAVVVEPPDADGQRAGGLRARPREEAELCTAANERLGGYCLCGRAANSNSG